MENRLRWGFWSNVLLISLMKKLWLLMISYEVRELTEELRPDLSETLNSLGLMAHSLLLRRVFICDCLDLRCRNSCTFDFLRKNFSQIMALILGQSSAWTVRFLKQRRLSMEYTLADWLSQIHRSWYFCWKVTIQPSPRISPAWTIMKGTSFFGRRMDLYSLCPLVLRYREVAACLATAFMSLNSPEWMMYIFLISSPSWKRTCPQVISTSWMSRQMLSREKVWRCWKMGKEARKVNLLRLSVFSCALDRRSQVFLLTASNLQLSTAMALVALMLFSPIISPKHPPLSTILMILSTQLDFASIAGRREALGSLKAGNIVYPSRNSLFWLSSSAGYISSGMVKWTVPSSIIQKQLESSLMRQTVSPSSNCANSIFWAISVRSLTLLVNQ